MFENTWFRNDALDQNWVFSYFWYKWLLFSQKMVHFMRNLLFFNLKAVFHKIGNW